ncbi:conserved Plasmodium protein, unknown function [Plasmodium vivax]|uniref:Uncharacterized protein n=4 Tax=Plasmodium vivax TaxID=5855 RepID=A0A0J9T5U4_PLAVI|nr:hypothetical protein PVBG_04327 [Plasmodium vivax Brazil I]KMZ90464.1 hypothetical protein PVMG_03313 [Plasmodium vivax Mauritania I]KMZ97081.1 hypothetical protein PVNG_00109 [Plasmodium vivax North Korean]CAG9471915.1 unnamed protein product [Plasmodium vivax]CAI7723270.1 conserved Plasmodium protein, unknown function [Plasmodium vivax]
MKGKKQKKDPSENKGSQKKEPTNLKRKKYPSDEHDYDSKVKHEQHDENYKISSPEVNTMKRGKKKELTAQSEKKEAEHVLFRSDNGDGGHPYNGEGPPMSNVEMGKVKQPPKVKKEKQSIGRGDGAKGNPKEDASAKKGNKRKKKDRTDDSDSSSRFLFKGRDMAKDGERANGAASRMLQRMDNRVAKEEGREEKRKEEEEEKAQELHQLQQLQQEQEQPPPQRKEELRMQEIAKYYGTVRVKNANSQVGKGDLLTLRNKLNTNLKVSDCLAIVQLSSPEDADNKLVSPFMCENWKDLKAERVKGGSKEGPQLDDHFRHARWKFPLEIIDHLIFKNKTHDYDKWVADCRILLVTGLPFDQKEEHILQSLIDMYYRNQDRDPILDVIDIETSDYLVDALNLYAAVEEHPSKYELFADHLGIIKFALLFGAKQNASINLIDHTYVLYNLSELCRSNHCPTGAMGLLYFKNEESAKNFWIAFKSSATYMYEKCVRVIPDKNEMKVYIEASIYFIMPGALFVNINYAQLNLVLNNLQQKGPVVFDQINNLKLRYHEKSVWELISENVPLDDAIDAEAPAQRAVGERSLEGNDQLRGASIGQISSTLGTVTKGKINQDGRNGVGAQKDENEVENVLDVAPCDDDSQSSDGATDDGLNEFYFENSFDENDSQEMEEEENALLNRIHLIPNFLMRIYNTHINRYLLEKGLCLLTCPYLDEESGKKVASFLTKFHLLDWTFSETDDACYFYLFKSIISVFSVSKKVFKGAFNYAVSTLFLKLPFGLVPALYIRLSPRLLGNLGDPPQSDAGQNVGGSD